MPVLTAMVLALPATAQPCSLAQLLQMSLERLLQLQVTPRRTALDTSPVTLAALASQGVRRQP